MGYPVFHPPVHHSVVFHLESGEKSPPGRHAVAFTNPMQYGVSIRDYNLTHIDPRWPGMTHYQAVYGQSSKPKYTDAHSACRRCPVPFPGPEDFKLPPIHVKCQGRVEPSLFKLYEKVPLPLLAKRIRGCHYQVNQPVGMLTKEEQTKCRLGILGPEEMSWRTEYDDVFIPNYRYKEWVDLPLPKLAEEMESNILTCRAPAHDTKHYDFYHQVRMHRPTPDIPENKFLSCAVVPMPGSI